MLSPNIIHHLLGYYGYPALFFAVLVEGPSATIIGAFIASQGFLDVYVVYVIAVIGDLMGDLAYYSVGRFGRRGIRTGVWRMLGITEERLLPVAQHFERHGAKILIFAKYTQTGIIILPASGAARMPVARFLWFNALGTLPKAFGLVIVGYFFGYAYNRINDDLMKTYMLLFGVFCIVGFYVLLRRCFRLSYEDR